MVTYRHIVLGSQTNFVALKMIVKGEGLHWKNDKLYLTEVSVDNAYFVYLPESWEIIIVITNVDDGTASVFIN